jgi:hypothetical protein
MRLPGDVVPGLSPHFAGSGGYANRPNRAMPSSCFAEIAAFTMFSAASPGYNNYGSALVAWE